MPSWNIHIAQTERLLNRGGVVAQTVVDRNAFLFGNLVPDIYVGYMVPGIEHPIAYRVTHVARPEHIPKPREWEFWDAYVAPLARRLGISAGTPREGADQPIPVALLSVEQDYVSRLHYPQRYAEAEPPVWQACAADEDTSPEAVDASRFDLVLGAWSHLVADNLWNTRVNEFLEVHGGRPSESFRIKKQGDFDRFGKALPLDMVPRATKRLIAAAAAFPQYPIEEQPTLFSIGVAHETVRTNHGDQNPRYELLTTDFFEHVFAEALDRTEELLAERL